MKINKTYNDYELDNIKYKTPVTSYRFIYKIRYKVINELKYAYKSMPDFTKNQLNSIRAYKRYSWNMNMQIREGIKKDSRKSRKRAKKILELYQILENSSVFDNIVVNRKIRKRELTIIKNKYNDFISDNKNKYFYKSDFCSTYTVPVLNATTIGKEVGFLVILIPKGSKALYLDSTKKVSYKREKELLIQKGSTFEFIVDEQFKDKNIFVVRLCNNQLC